MIWIAIGLTALLIVLSIKRIKRNNRIYAELHDNFHQWLHQFDDPETHD